MLLILRALKKLASIFFILLFISCANEYRPTIYSHTGKALGTSFKILYSSDKPLKNIEYLTNSIFFEINQSMSTYIKNSDISKINSGIGSVKVDYHFEKVFNKSKIIWKSTDGFFDPTIGLLVKAYGLGPENNQQNSVNIDSLMNFTGFEKVSLKNNLVLKDNPGIFLDFNAIAKGYCVDEISKMLKKNNITNHLVEIGGEMVAKGINEVNNSPWRVGIIDPLNSKSNNFIETIELRNKALASSGNYRKYITDKRNGNKIVHTINPKTGNAYETNILGSSVVAEDCITADAYATSFMAMPLKKSLELISNLKNIDVMIVYYDKKNNVQVYRTEGFDKLILN
jgi:thiamine biosynthesis lipoprotein